MNRILLLEDDVSLIDGLVYSLKKNEFDVEVARTVCEAKQYLSELDRYDLLILDVTLPDGTGFDICEKVRKENQQIPIIFLTASDEEVSIIRGLDSGGDDYITKPFKLGELCSRIRALLRRARVSKSEKNTSMECGDIIIDLLDSRATLKGKALDFQLVSELNVEQNIIFPLLLDYRKPDPAEVEEILDLLGLTERRHHLPNQLSGGQQQRVAIGRALITKPKLILADEPTGNLDSKNSQDVMALLTQASRRYQQTILMITHNKNLTASVDRVFRVSDGVLTDLGGKKNEALS